MTLEKAAQDKLSATEARMKKAVEAVHKDMGTIRTGRASPTLVEHLLVDYYGVPTPLNQIAAISIPEARLIVIQPWDKSAMPYVEKAILKSELGLTPSNDGNLVRIPIPPLSEERRRDLVKVVRKRLEDGRVAVRNIRRDALEDLRKLEKDQHLSQDVERRAQDTLQKLTDRYIAAIDELGKKKEAELMEV